MNHSEKKYATINGLNMYHEIYGANTKATPLVLVHGGFGSTSMFTEMLPMFSQTRPVIAVDLQAHGRTADIERPLSYENLGDDIAALVVQLGFAQADLMGYSLGGGTVLQTTIRHPEVVRKLVVVSTPYKRQAWYADVLHGMADINAAWAETMKPTPMYKQYASLAPHPEDWPILANKMGELLRREYDHENSVAKILKPTLIVCGDADSFSPLHAAQFFALLGGGKQDAGWNGAAMPNSRLAILPATTHYNILKSSMLVPEVLAFLDAAMPNTGMSNE